MRSTAFRFVATLLLLSAPIVSSAQMAHRLKGSLRTEAGAPIASAMAPKDQRQAIAAAIDDLRGMSRIQ